MNKALLTAVFLIWAIRTVALPITLPVSGNAPVARLHFHLTAEQVIGAGFCISYTSCDTVRAKVHRYEWVNTMHIVLCPLWTWHGHCSIVFDSCSASCMAASNLIPSEIWLRLFIFHFKTLIQGSNTRKCFSLAAFNLPIFTLVKFTYVQYDHHARKPLNIPEFSQDVKKFQL